MLKQHFLSLRVELPHAKSISEQIAIASGEYDRSAFCHLAKNPALCEKAIELLMATGNFAVLTTLAENPAMGRPSQERMMALIEAEDDEVAKFWLALCLAHNPALAPELAIALVRLYCSDKSKRNGVFHKLASKPSIPAEIQEAMLASVPGWNTLMLLVANPSITPAVQLFIATEERDARALEALLKNPALDIKALATLEQRAFADMVAEEGMESASKIFALAELVSRGRLGQ